MSWEDLDPTGALSAASAAVGLVGSVLRVAPAIKNIANQNKAAPQNPQNSQNPGAPAPLQRTESAPQAIPSIQRDPERERRAYETVNFVLREIGTRLCAAGLVDEHALTRALTAATQHIEVRLFSGEANRLFESLAPKLSDPILVNSVFTSIYLLGALTAELTTSLPNYKDTYIPLGPRMIQQLFRAAIGDDAFRENLTANLDAFKTLAATAGLLRPTDIGYHTFPKFPSFIPSKYSSKSFSDVRQNKNGFDKLVKHFARAGFPQPTAARQAEVGLIRDWRFLTGDTNSQMFDVERADKNIGENFGKTLHWLVCSAERLPPGQAIIAYYDQHVELIKWIGHRMGYAVLYPAWDLNLGGPHAQLDGKCQAILHSWVVLMSSQAAQAAKRAASEQWVKARMQAAARVPNFAPPPPKPQNPPVAQAVPPPATVNPMQAAQAVPVKPIAHPGVTAQAVPPQRAVNPGPAAQPMPFKPTVNPGPAAQPIPTQYAGQPVSPISPTAAVAPQPAPVPVVQPQPGPAPAPPLATASVDEQIETVRRHFSDVLLPSCRRLLSNLPMEAKLREFQCNEQIFALEKDVLFKLDSMQVSENQPAKNRRREIVMHAQQLMEALDAARSTGQAYPHPDAPQPQANTQINSSSSPSSPGSLGSPPPYSPASLGQAPDANPTQSLPFPQKRMSTVIRRKAPPPPKKFTPAKAIFDFEPDEEEGGGEKGEDEIGFKEGDDIEIIAMTAELEAEGWCRGRVKGQKKVGLMPLEYLEIQKGAQTAAANAKPPAQNEVSLPENVPSISDATAHPTNEAQTGPLNNTDNAAAAQPTQYPFSPQVNVELQHGSSHIPAHGLNQSYYDQQNILNVRPQNAPPPVGPVQGGQFGNQPYQGSTPNPNQPHPIQPHPPPQKHKIGKFEAATLGLGAAGVAATLMTGNPAPASGHPVQQETNTTHTQGNQDASQQDTNQTDQGQVDQNQAHPDQGNPQTSNGQTDSSQTSTDQEPQYREPQQTGTEQPDSTQIPVSTSNANESITTETVVETQVTTTENTAGTDLSAFSEPPFESQPSVVSYPITSPGEPAIVPEYPPPVIPDTGTTTVETQEYQETVYQPVIDPTLNQPVTDPFLYPSSTDPSFYQPVMDPTFNQPETDPSLPFVSPFACLATPAPVDSTTYIQDTSTTQTVDGVTTTYESTTVVEEEPSTAIPVAETSTETVSSAEYTQWNAGGEVDEAAFDFEF